MPAHPRSHLLFCTSRSGASSFSKQGNRGVCGHRGARGTHWLAHQMAGSRRGDMPGRGGTGVRKGRKGEARRLSWSSNNASLASQTGRHTSFVILRDISNCFFCALSVARRVLSPSKGPIRAGAQAGVPDVAKHPHSLLIPLSRACTGGTCTTGPHVGALCAQGLTGPHTPSAEHFAALSTLLFASRRPLARAPDRTTLL